LGILKHIKTGLSAPLRVRTRLGRSPDAEIVHEDARVSTEHALIRWSDGAWWLQDLGSTNGTFLAGARLRVGEPTQLGPGAMLGLGSPEVSWMLEDDGPPAAFARSSRGELRPLLEGRIAIHCEGALAAVVLQGPDGHWLVQREGRETRIRDGEVVELSGVSWTLTLPATLPRTLRANITLRVEQVTLRLKASQDLEDVEVIVVGPGGERTLGVRAYGYFLLELARQRSADRAEGLAEQEQGWVAKSDQEAHHRLAENQLNVWMSRFRGDLLAVGVVNAKEIFQMRDRGRKIRLAVDGFE
jgi:hypothetical protein